MTWRLLFLRLINLPGWAWCKLRGKKHRPMGGAG